MSITSNLSEFASDFNSANDGIIIKTSSGIVSVPDNYYSTSSNISANLSIIHGVNDSQNTSIINLESVNLTQNTIISSAFSQANSAFDNSNTKFSSSGGTVSGDVTITGNVVVSGMTTTINVDTVTVKDKNIVLANVASPTDVTADGAGLTIKGTTDKTWNWVDSNDSWTSSENLNLLSGKTYKINGTDVLTGSALGSGITSSSLTSVGTLSSLSVSGTTSLANVSYTGTLTGGTGILNIGSGQIYKDANGNIGIGSSSPIADLHIAYTEGSPNTSLYTTDALIISANNTAPGINIISSGNSSGYRGVFKATRCRGSLENPTVPLINDFSLSILGAIYDGTSNFSTAAINIEVDGSVSSNVCPQRITFYTGEGASRIERLRVDSSGKVGIGTSSPQALLSIGSGSAAGSNPTHGGSVLIASQMNSLSSVGGVEFRSVNFASGYGHRISSPDLSGGNTPLVFERRTNSVSWSESLRVTSSGDVLITGGGGQLISERFQVKGTTLGGNSGDKSYNTSFYTPDTSNTTRINILDYRHTSGTSHTSSRNLIQRRVDSTDMGYVGFDSSATSIGWGTTEHFRIDSSGNVGIGISSTSGKLSVLTNTAVTTYAQTWEVYNGATFQFTNILGGDSTNGVYFGPFQNVPLRFITNNLERLRIDSSGTLILNQGQIKFPATQVASADANTLDDYEEGTWTCSLVPSSGFSPTSNQTTAHYTKIGNTVFVSGHASMIVPSSLGTYANNNTSFSLFISGLPFSIGSGIQKRSAPVIGVHVNIGTTNGVVAGHGTETSTYISIFQNKFDGSVRTSPNLSINTTVTIHFQYTYFV